MLDISHIPTQYPNADVQVFTSPFQYLGNQFTIGYWKKPRGKSMCHILCIGAGGNGGAGVIGANSLAGGGGGGGSGGQTSIRFPLWAIPDTLCILHGAGAAQGRIRVQVGDFDDGGTNIQNVLCSASSGGNGGNGTAVPAGGIAGAAGAVVTSGSMPLGWQWVQQAIAGQAGAVGQAATAGGSLNLPTTGLLVTGGAGGGGLPAAATTGSNGGQLNGAGVFGGSGIASGPASATSPAGSGNAGYTPFGGLLYFYGGSGGASTHGSATGAGLVQGSGGDGAYGCGGGGSGAALTGSTAGVVGKGGPAICIITCW